MKTVKLSNIQRFNRLLAGIVLIAFTLLSNATPLGWLAVLPLLATYPLFSALYGYDPVYEQIIRRALNIANVITVHHASHKAKHG